MDLSAVASTYKRWAPVYDETFGLVTRQGRRRAVDYINTRPGRVLEVGVGTGLSLRDYDSRVEVTGIDYSHDMLAKARRRVEAENLENVSDLRQMDARELDFPNDQFDVVVAMFLVSVVPDPEKVVAEMARVCKPGGEVLIVNHFARDRGVLSALEKGFAPFANLLGWHSDFPIERVLGAAPLEVREHRTLPPLGMFTFLRLGKSP